MSPVTALSAAASPIVTISVVVLRCRVFPVNGGGHVLLRTREQFDFEARAGIPRIAHPDTGRHQHPVGQLLYMILSLLCLCLAGERLSKDRDVSGLLHSIFGEADDQEQQVSSPPTRERRKEPWGEISSLVVASPIAEGVNGVYLVKDARGVPAAVFKPTCEESYSSDNPRDGIVVEQGGMSPEKAGISVGDATVKEKAAFLIDRHHLAGVPYTDVVELNGKIGSLQHYIDNLGSAEEFSSSKFSTRDVQAIALLDLRTMNIDRHMGNILVKQAPGGGLRLVPIDHGYILPDFRHMSEAWYEWYSWDQASAALDPALAQYMRALDILADADTLLRTGVRPSSVITYILCTLFVKHMLAKNKTLRDMAVMMQRDVSQYHRPSQFEELVAKALHAWPSAPAVIDTAVLRSQSFQRFIESFDALCYSL